MESSQRPLARMRNQAVIELTFASVLWGFGFVAVVWSLRSMGPLSISGWRFLIAAAAGFGIMLFAKRLPLRENSEALRLAAVPGLLLSTMVILQTWGLKYTTTAKSGFITTLYVLMVPLIEGFFLNKKIPRSLILAVLIALIGVALICNLPNELLGAPTGDKGSWNFGDLLTFACAIMASLHIIWFGVIRDRIGDPFIFNNFQSLWAGLPALLLAFILEPFTLPSWSDYSLIGLIALSLGSSLVAFALQVKAQKVLSPSFASLLFLLESPFAALFGFWLLDETLNGFQVAGATLILAATGLATLAGAHES